MNPKIDFSNNDIGNKNKYILIGICATILIAAVLLTVLGCFLKNRSKTQNPQHPRKPDQQPTVDSKETSRDKTPFSRNVYDESSVESEKADDHTSYSHRINSSSTKQIQMQQQQNQKSEEGSLLLNMQVVQSTQLPPPPPQLPNNFFATHTTTNASSYKERASILPNQPAQQQPNFDLGAVKLRTTAIPQFDKNAIPQEDVKKYFKENLICITGNAKNAITKKLAAGGGTNTMEYKFGITAIADFSYQNGNPNAANLSFKATICEDLNAKNPTNQEVEFLFQINDENKLELLNENETDNQNEKQIDRLKKSMINYKEEISTIIIAKWNNFVKDYKAPNAAFDHNIASLLESSSSRSISDS